MILLTKSPAARTALVYVTVGALTIIWSGVWLVYLLRNPPTQSWVFYVVTGFIISGVSLLLLGLGLGRLGRAARDAEEPAATVVANPPAAQVVVPASPVAPAVTVAEPANGQVLAASSGANPAGSTQEGPVKVLR